MTANGSSQGYRNFLLQLYGCIVVILFLIPLAINQGDDVRWINGHHTSMLDVLFSSMTHLGEGWIFVPLIIVSLFIRFYVSILGLAVAVIHGVICAIAKNLIFTDSPRPTQVLDNSVLYFVPGVEVHGQHAFPSGHTATIFCAAIFASILFRHRLLSVVWLLVALLVACSRIYLLQHFLIDIAGGALIGVLTAFICWYYFERARWPDWMYRYLQIRVAGKDDRQMPS